VSVTAQPVSNNSVCSLTFNDELIPTSTHYIVSVSNSTGALISGFPQKWRLSGGGSGSINVSNGYPLFYGTVVFPDPILSTPPTNATQSINSPLTLNGYDLHAGDVYATNFFGIVSHLAITDKTFINPVTDCANVPTNGTSDATAALRACRALYPGRRFILPKLQAYNVAACDYTITDSIIRGTDTNGTSEIWEGGGGSSGQAENFPSAVRICSSAGATQFEIPASYGAGFTIRNLHLIGSECFTPTSAATFVMPLGWGGTSTADGIRAHARVKIENVTAECFGRHGINLDTDGYNGNVNDSTIHTVLTTKNRGVGTFIRGQDSQAAHFTGISSTTNQLDGFVDQSFLGNTHAAHHSDANGIDQTADGPAIAITSSVVSANYATITAIGHGLTRGDMVRQASTVNGLLNGRFHVLSVPTVDTYIIYTPQQDRAVTVEVASAFKLLGAVTWKKTLSGCGITLGQRSLICDSGGLLPNGVIGYPVTIPGAGAAGADLVTFTTAGPSTFCSVTTWGITSNVLTVNCVNTFTVGQFVKLVFFDNGDVRDTEVQVATASAGDFTASVTHSDIALHANATARVYFPQVFTRDPALTTVTGAAGTIFYRSVPYRAIGDSNTSQWDTVYSEGSQNASIFGHRNLIKGGDHGAGVDFYPLFGGAGKWEHTTANGYQIDAPGATLYTAGNKNVGLSHEYQPGVGFTMLHRWYTFDTTTKLWVERFRLDAGTIWNLLDIPDGTKSIIRIDPVNDTAQYFCTSDGAACTQKLGSDTYTASWEFRSLNVVVASIDSGGKGTFAGVVTTGANGVQESCTWGIENLTLATGATTTDTSANLLPANSYIRAVETRVTTAITAAATTFSVGDPTTAARFSAAAAGLTLGSTRTGLDHLSGAVTTLAAGPTQAANAKVRITTDANPGAGAIRIAVLACTYTPPTS
jgi:hypothetical protein